jgi:uncharacterized membrane protein YdbT with pleckstrin-like domain
MPKQPDNPARPQRQAAIPEGHVRPDEKVILSLKPSWAFGLLVSISFWEWLGVLLAGAWALDTWRLVKLPMYWLVAVAITAALVRLVVAAVQWLCRTYVLTDQRVIRIKGVLWVRVFECPLSRIQNTDLSMPLSQRVFGAGTLYFSTAGTAGLDPAWAVIAEPTEVHQVVSEWVRRAQVPTGPPVP